MSCGSALQVADASKQQNITLMILRHESFLGIPAAFLYCRDMGSFPMTLLALPEGGSLLRPLALPLYYEREDDGGNVYDRTKEG